MNYVEKKDEDEDEDVCIYLYVRVNKVDILQIHMSMSIKEERID